MQPEAPSRKINVILGSLFMGLGAIIACLVFIDRRTEISLPLPGVWHDLRSFHLVACLTFFVLGAWAHRLAAAVPDSTGPLFQQVTVYSKPDCELCDRAMVVLNEFASSLPSIQVVDITGDPELQSQHGQSIPVVEIDGTIRFRGIVSRELLQRLVDARQRQLANDAENTPT